MMGSAEVNAFLSHLAVGQQVSASTQNQALVAGLLYGSGLRLIEALRLRVHDLDFSRHELMVRDGKGGRDRRTLLPDRLGARLRGHLEEVRQIHPPGVVRRCVPPGRLQRHPAGAGGLSRLRPRADQRGGLPSAIQRRKDAA